MSFMLGAMALHADVSRTGRDDFACVRKLILMAFCNEAADNGVIAARFAGKTSNTRLAAVVARDQRTVRRAKQQLIEDGWLIQVGEARRGQGKVALFRVNVDRLRANIRAREAELFAVEPEDRGTALAGLEENGTEFSRSKLTGVSAQDAENKSDENLSRSKLTGVDEGIAAGGDLSTSESDQAASQAAENEGEPRLVGQNCPTKSAPVENEGLVGQSSQFSRSKLTTYPISPSPPYSPPPSGEAGGAPDWRSLRDGLAAEIGQGAARGLLASARLEGRTLLFANRFSFLDARDHHADALAALGVEVIAKDEPCSEAVALSALAGQNRRAAP